MVTKNPLVGDFVDLCPRAYALGRASETVSMRPPNSLPFHMEIALSAELSSISTKQKPRERPVSRSVTMDAETTSPAWAKASRSSSFVVRYGSPPTKSLRAISTKNFFYYVPRKATLLARLTWRQRRLTHEPRYCSTPFLKSYLYAGTAVMT